MNKTNVRIVPFDLLQVSLFPELRDMIILWISKCTSSYCFRWHLCAGVDHNPTWSSCCMSYPITCTTGHSQRAFRSLIYLDRRTILHAEY